MTTHFLKIGQAATLFHKLCNEGNKNYCPVPASFAMTKQKKLNITFAP
jgi:hypothetical protein